MKKLIVALTLLILVSGCIGAEDTADEDIITGFDNSVDSLEGLDKDLANGELDNLDNDLNFDL